MATMDMLHIDKALSNVSIAYQNSDFIADEIFKAVPVQKQSDKYYEYGFEHFSPADDSRAPTTEANEVDWKVSNDQYFAQGHALRALIADEEMQDADAEFDLEAESTELVTDKILLNKEIAAANLLTNPSNYYTGLSLALGSNGTYQWSDYVHSNPQQDVLYALRTIHQLSGINANVMIVSRAVFDILKLHPVLIDLIKYTQRGVLTEELMAQLFGVEKILIGNALFNSSADQFSPNLNYIWGNNVVLGYVPPRAGRRVPALGYTFMWNKDGAGAVQVRKWYERSRRATVIEAERWYDMKIVSNMAGFVFTNTIAPTA